MKPSHRRCLRIPSTAPAYVRGAGATARVPIRPRVWTRGVVVRAGAHRAVRSGSCPEPVRHPRPGRSARRHRAPWRGCTSAGSPPMTPPTWDTPPPTSPSTWSTATGAISATRSTTCRTSPTSTTRCSSGPWPPARTGGSWPAPRPHCSPRTWRRSTCSRRATTSGRSSRSPRSSSGSGGCATPRGVRRRWRPVLHDVRSRGVRGGLRAGRGGDAGDLRRAWRGSRPARQARPRWTACCGRRRAPMSRRGTPHSGTVGPVAHRVHGDRPGPPGHGLRRAGRRLGPRVPAPRDVLGPGRDRDGSLRSPSTSCMPGWSATRATR